MKKLLLAIDWISIWAGKIFSIPLFIVDFIILYEIIARYFFKAPTQWASETMIIGCALSYVMGGAWAMYSDKHIKVGLIYDNLPPRGKAILDAITFLFFILYLGLFFWAVAKFSWESIQLKETSGSAWNAPVYPIKTVLTIGVLLLILQGIAKFIRDLHFIIKGEEL
jgi:TRAP-type mannitol/chloroaromatic compound transport system permease small subunit